MFERAKAILIKEFKQIFRDPRMKTIIFIAPLIQIILFGYSANRDITYVPTAVYDKDNTSESRELIRRFTYSKYFVPEATLSSDRQQDYVLDRGKVNTVIRIERGFGRNIKAGKNAGLQLVFDGTDSNSAMIIMGYADEILHNYQQDILKAKADNLGLSSIASVDLRERSWFNGNLISRNYYLPGVVATIVTVMSLMLSAMAIVKEKEIGTMEQLTVSPLKPIELIIGKLLPFGIIALLQVIFVSLLGIIWFHIPLRGSILFLLLSTCIYLFTTLGIGLFISTISSTQQEANMAVFLFYLPAVLLSGFTYPIANMPSFIRFFTIFNPMRYFMVVIRSIFLKGTGIQVLWPQLVPLFLIGVAVIILSALRFRKKLI